MSPQSVRVREAIGLSPTLRHLRLEPADGGFLPPAQAGAHAQFSLRTGERARRNAYSLTALPADRRHVEIVVRLLQASRGGSAHVHRLRAGDILEMGTPQNLFPVAKLARRHLLLAAGVGVTPFLAYLPALAHAGVPATLHQFCRADEAGVFANLLADHAARANIHVGAGKPDLAALLADQPLGTHVSICGPGAFMTQVERAALAAGFAPGHIHRESFAGAAPGAAFVAQLARSGRQVSVDEDSSLLEALEQAGFDPPNLCRGGVCGQCRIGVLSGVPDHRDHVLSPEERRRGDAIMTCVSRARTPELVLDL